MSHRRRLLIAAFVFGLMLASVSQAEGSHSITDHISIGPAGGNGSADAVLRDISHDGSRAWFETTESLVSTDTDAGHRDVYERTGTTTTLISAGAGGSSSPRDATFLRASADGSTVVFATDESLVPADTDGISDIYKRQGATFELVSIGPSGGNGSSSANTLKGVSTDGSRVLFDAIEQLVPSDTDQNLDVYERSGGTTALVSTGPAGGNGNFYAAGLAISADGTRMLFNTGERLVPEDNDGGGEDIYQRSGSTTTLISTGPATSNANVTADWGGVSTDGTRVFFATPERLVAGDTDNQSDVYERAGGATTLVSTGPAGGNGATGSFFTRATPDGSTVLFFTIESLVSSDTDTYNDVYKRSAGTTELVSVGPASSNNGPHHAFAQSVSDDGATVYFTTTEQLVSADTDAQRDIYARSGGTTELVSIGPGGGNGAIEPLFAGSSRDGVRVFFGTLEALVPGDVDGRMDIYEHAGGITYLISVGPAGGNGPYDICFPACPFFNSDDGERVFFHTNERLMSADTDMWSDVYAVSVGTNYPRPKGATPVRVALVPAFSDCANPNRMHGPPLSFASCAPPVQTSPNLTFGTPDADGAAANSIGSVRLDAHPGAPGPPEDSGVTAQLSMTDVRCVSGATPCGPANSAGGADYTGEVQLVLGMHITDKWNGTAPGGGPDAATVNDISLPVTGNCAATSDSGVGSTCTIGLDLAAIYPSIVRDTKRTIWQLDQVQVRDGGPDGDVDTANNSLFAVQGVFVP